MYNPARYDSTKVSPQRDTPPPGSGITRGTIMNRQRHTAPAGDKVQTQCGHTIKLFSNDAFGFRHETMQARTATGLVKNDDGDRAIYVVRGSLFVNVKDAKGLFDTYKLVEGQHINVPRGTEHELATSGDFGADFLVVESAEYDKKVQKFTAPTIGAVIPAADALQAAPTVVRRGQDPRTVAQAQEMAEQNVERRRRAAQRKPENEFGNANSANTIGVNPMPSGPPQEE